jgi:hypothetical protein
VKPGIVLISFTTMLPPPSRKKSTRAKPSPPIASKAVTAHRRSRSLTSSGTSAGVDRVALPSTYLASKS